MKSHKYFLIDQFFLCRLHLRSFYQHHYFFFFFWQTLSSQPRETCVQPNSLSKPCNSIKYETRNALLFIHQVVSDSLWPHEHQRTRLPCLSLSLRACSNSCPLSQWCHPTISSSITPFSSCPQSFPASESFPVSQLFTSGGQSTGASASASVLPMNIQGWFSLELTGLIFFLSKEISRVFLSTAVGKHQFFSSQPSLWSISHIHTWLLEKS